MGRPGSSPGTDQYRNPRLRPAYLARRAVSLFHHRARFYLGHGDITNSLVSGTRGPVAQHVERQRKYLSTRYERRRFARKANPMIRTLMGTILIVSMPAIALRAQETTVHAGPATLRSQHH